MASKWLQGYVWDKRTHNYHRVGAKGFVKRAKILDLLGDSLRDREKRLLKGMEAVIDGRISPMTWLSRTSAMIKREHLQNAALAAGGWDRLTPSDYGKLGANLRNEYQHLARMAGQIAAGDVTLPQGIERMKMYVGGARAEFFRIERDRKEVKQGYVLQAKRVLNPGESCEDCIAMSRWSWKPADAVPLPTVDSQCGNHCNCDIMYREVPANQTVTEFNPYHDASGRFATAGGGVAPASPSQGVVIGQKGRTKASGLRTADRFQVVGINDDGSKVQAKFLSGKKRGDTTWIARSSIGDIDELPGGPVQMTVQGKPSVEPPPVKTSAPKEKPKTQEPVEPKPAPKKETPAKATDKGPVTFKKPGTRMSEEEAAQFVKDNFDLDGSEYSKSCAAWVTRQFPKEVLVALKAKGVKWTAGDKPGITEIDSNQDLVKMNPRGWPPDKGYNQVDGAYRPDRKMVNIAHRPGTSAGGVSVHETMHALGHVMRYDYDKRITEAHAKAYDSLPPYAKQEGPGGYAGRQEWVAMAVEYHMTGARGGATSGAVYKPAIDILIADGVLLP